MDTKELLTVKEVAEILGVSVQAIYNRLENDLKPYLKIVNGKKRLNKAVLQYITPKENSSTFQVDFKGILNLLEKQNEQLSQELKIKNEQIRELNVRLAEAHKMANNAQQLHSADKVLELQAPAKDFPKKQGLLSRILKR